MVFEDLHPLFEQMLARRSPLATNAHMLPTVSHFATGACKFGVGMVKLLAANVFLRLSDLSITIQGFAGKSAGTLCHEGLWNLPKGKDPAL